RLRRPDPDDGTAVRQPGRRRRRPGGPHHPGGGDRRRGRHQHHRRRHHGPRPGPVRPDRQRGPAHHRRERRPHPYGPAPPAAHAATGANVTLAADQRGLAYAGAPDIGAFESIPADLTATKTNSAGGTAVVISQVYGGGGNTGATYTHDFIELHNRGNVEVSL